MMRETGLCGNILAKEKSMQREPIKTQDSITTTFQYFLRKEEACYEVYLMMPEKSFVFTSQKEE